MKLYQKSAAELAVLLTTRECSAEELTASVLERIREVEFQVGAYLHVEEQSALDTARRLDAARMQGERLHPLAGIPMGIKDNICTKGMPTTCASRMLEGFIPPYDATVVDRLKAVGAVLLGKCNMDEFAMGGSNETSWFHPTCNPWNLDYVAGGSSGGSAAAVAAGEAVFTLGSDTGGSIRQPASFCGIVGLKPTYGAVSRHGLIAHASSLDQIGPMARTVRDVGLIQSVIAGVDDKDHSSININHGDMSDLAPCALKGIRIGVPREYMEHVQPEVARQVEAAVTKLQEQGALAEQCSLPGVLYGAAAYYTIACVEASSNLARYDGIRYGYRPSQYSAREEMIRRSRDEGFGDEVKRRILLGTYLLSAQDKQYYRRAQSIQRQIIREHREAFTMYDLLIAPAASCPAFKGKQAQSAAKNYATDNGTVAVSLAGLPALSLPCGMVEGLPVGIQLIGDRFCEKRLLEVGQAWEEICGGFPMTDIRGKGQTDAV